MKLYTFKCDKCGTEETGECSAPKGQFIEVDVTYAFVSYGKSTVARRLYCRACAVALGVFPPHTDEDKKSVPEKPPTIEEMIAEIVRGEIDNCGKCTAQ